MALCLSLLLMMLLAIVQFALYEHARNVVTAAAQEGARVASSDGRSVSDGVAYAQTLVAAGLGGSLLDLQVTGTDGPDTVNIQAQGQLPIAIPWLTPVRVPVSADAVMHKEKFYAGPNP